MKAIHILRIAVITLATVFTSCSGIDINDEQVIVKDLQGTWIGYEHKNNIYRHIKLVISDNTFSGWLLTSESDNEPAWTALPSESGTISLSSVQNIPNEPGKYRKISFFMRGRCCGDNSLTARILSEMIRYHEGRGLCITDQTALIRK